MLTKLLRNTGFSITADLATRIINTLLFILISRSIGVPAAGVFSLGLSYFFLASRFSYWGLDTLLTRQVARRYDEAGRYLTNFVAMRVVTAFIAITIVNIVTHIIPYSQQTRVTIALLCVSILPESVSELCQALFIAFERIHYITLVSILDGLAKLAIGSFCIATGSGVETVALAMTLVNTATMALYLLLATRPLTPLDWRIDWRFCAGQLRIALPFVFIGMFFILDSRIDVILLSVLTSERSVGLYSAAVTVITALSMLPQGFRTAVYPVLARYQATSAEATLRLYTLSFKYLLLLALPMTAGTALIANEIVQLVYKPAFAPSGMVLSIAVWSLLAYSLNILNSRFLIVSDRQSLVARFLLISATATVVLNLLLVPPLDVVGAAIVKTVTAVLLFALNEVAARRLLRGFSPWPLLWRPLIASAAMAGVVLLLKPYGLWLVIPAATVTYFATLLLLGTFPPDERDLWKNALNQLRKQKRREPS